MDIWERSRRKIALWVRGQMLLGLVVAVLIYLLLSLLAVKYALKGVNGKMVTLVREKGPKYKCTTGLAELRDVANGEKKVPREYINEAGNHITNGA